MADTLLDSERLSRAGLPKIPTEYEPLVKMLRGAIKQIVSNAVEDNYDYRISQLLRYIKNNSNTRKKYFINAARDSNLPFAFANFQKPIRKYVYNLAMKDYENDDESWLYEPTGDGEKSPLETVSLLNEFLANARELKRMQNIFQDPRFYRLSGEELENLPDRFSKFASKNLELGKSLEKDIGKLKLKKLAGNYESLNIGEERAYPSWFWPKEKLESIPTEQDVMLDPMMYSDHPYEFVRGFARKLINGEI